MQGLATLITIVATSAKQRKDAETEYYNSVMGQQAQYNLLLNEQIGLQAEASGSVFYKDFGKTITAGFEQMADAEKHYQESVEALENGKAKTGKKVKVDLKAIGAGAAAGATYGAIAGAGVFSWAGAAIGAVGGAIVGLIGGLKKKDTFAPLLEAWPGLIDESKEGIDQFNVSLAQTLIDNNLVDDATKRNLETTKQWVAQYKEAQASIKSVISELAGQLGDDLRNGLVNAFKAGEDAAAAFGKSVGKILENILAQLIFSKVIGPALDQLEKEMNESSDTEKGGDGSWIDDMGRFLEKAPGLIKMTNDLMTSAQQQAAAVGIDIFKPDEASVTPDKKPLSGIATSVTEESVSMLSGQFNALRISQAEATVVVRQQLIALFEIRTNTGQTAANTQYLIGIAAVQKDVLAQLKRMESSDNLRAKGIFSDGG